MVVLACALPVSAADSPEATFLLPSTVSELEMVYETLRESVQKGDTDSFRSHFDPATLREETGNKQVTGAWLRENAKKWPDAGEWTMTDARGYGQWARLILRDKHVVKGRHDGRWDFYFLVYHRVDGHWRLARRAIGTFEGVGRSNEAPRLADLAIHPALELPPRATLAAAAAAD